MKDNIEELKKVAGAATPGPYTCKPDLSPINDGQGFFAKYDWLLFPRDGEAGPIGVLAGDKQAVFAKTFDPPTVLSLLRRVEELEKALKDSANRWDSALNDLQGQRFSSYSGKLTKRKLMRLCEQQRDIARQALEANHD